MLPMTIWRANSLLYCFKITYSGSNQNRFTWLVPYLKEALVKLHILKLSRGAKFEKLVFVPIRFSKKGKTM